VGNPLSREDGSAVCDYCWPLPAQLLNPSRAVLTTVFYFLTFKTPQTLAEGGGGAKPHLYPPEIRRPSNAPIHWHHFSSPPYD
jgi:hypothetical protein